MSAKITTLPFLCSLFPVTEELQVLDKPITAALKKTASDECHEKHLAVVCVCGGGGDDDVNLKCIRQPGQTVP